MRPSHLVCFSALGLLAGCPTGSDYSGAGATGSARRTTTSSSGAGSGPTSGTTGSGSSSSAGASASSSGNSSGGSTGNDCPPPDSSLDDCDAGVEIKVTLADGLSNAQITTTVQFEDLNSSGQTIYTATCGVLVLCPTVGQILALELQVDGYVPSIVNDIVADENQLYDKIPLFDIGLIQTEFAQLQDPAFNANLATVVVRMKTGNATLCTRTGWTFALEDLDGGPVAADAAALSGAGILFPNGETDSSGIYVLYDINTSATHVHVIGTLDPDAGAYACPFVGPEIELDGYTHLADQEFSQVAYPIDLLDAG